MNYATLYSTEDRVEGPGTPSLIAMEEGANILAKATVLGFSKEGANILAKATVLSFSFLDGLSWTFPHLLQLVCYQRNCFLFAYFGSPQGGQLAASHLYKDDWLG